MEARCRRSKPLPEQPASAQTNPTAPYAASWIQRMPHIPPCWDHAKTQPHQFRPQQHSDKKSVRLLDSPQRIRVHGIGLAREHSESKTSAKRERWRDLILKCCAADQRASTICVFDAIQVCRRLIRHAGGEMDSADEPHGARRKRRLIIAEKRP